MLTRNTKPPIPLSVPPTDVLINQTITHPIPIPQHVLYKSVKSHFPNHTPTNHYESPKSLDDLQRTILVARRHLRRLKPCTNPRSPSATAAHQSGALIVDTTALNAISRSKHTVTAQCGARLSQLPLPLIVPDISVGAALADGALALGGFAQGLVADCLVAISLVDSRGRLRMYKRDDPTGVFDTLLVSHGLCGIIFDATFETSFVERVVAVRLTKEPMHLVTPEGLMSVVDGRTAVEVSWIPYNSYEQGKNWESRNDSVIVKAVESTMDELSPGRGVHYMTIPEYIIRNCEKLAAGGYNAYNASHTRAILSQGYPEIAENYVTTLRKAVELEYNRHSVHEESVCFPLRLEDPSDWERITKAWQHVLQSVTACDKIDTFPLNVAMKLRFVGGSPGLLAANQSKVGCVLTIVSATGTSGWTAFAKQVVETWVSMGGRWVANRSGASMVDERVQMLKRFVRNAGLDDYGMFEDGMVGMREIRALQSEPTISEVSDFEEDIPLEPKPIGELWWVWLYIALYIALWWWLFGRDVVYTIRS